MRLSAREFPPVSSVHEHTLHECLALRNVHRLILCRYKTSGQAADYHVSLNLNLYLFTPALKKPLCEHSCLKMCGGRIYVILKVWGRGHIPHVPHVIYAPGPSSLLAYTVLLASYQIAPIRFSAFPADCLIQCILFKIKSRSFTGESQSLSMILETEVDGMDSRLMANNT